MIKLQNPFSAKLSRKALPQDEPAFTRFPAVLKPNYSRQPIAKPSERMAPAADPRASRPEPKQTVLNTGSNGETRIPIAVLQNALPLRFARMQAANSDEFVFQ